MSVGYRVRVRGPLPTGVAAEIRSRFGPVDVSAGQERVVLRGHVVDQAALRGLLTLLWDSNSDVIGVHVEG